MAFRTAVMSFIMGSWKNPVSSTKLNGKLCFLKALIMGSALDLRLHRIAMSFGWCVFKSSLVVSSI